MAKYWVMSGETVVGYRTLEEAMVRLQSELDKREILLSLGMIDSYPVRLAVTGDSGSSL